MDIVQGSINFSRKLGEWLGTGVFGAKAQQGAATVADKLYPGVMAVSDGVDNVVDVVQGKSWIGYLPLFLIAAIIIGLLKGRR